jgi:hypothetical protein
VNDFGNLDPLLCDSFKWNESVETSQMGEVREWFEMVLQLPHDCHVRDVHKKDKYQVHLENAKITILGGGDIAIGPSETPAIWIETKKSSDRFKEGQAKGELFVLDRQFPIHSMIVLTDCNDWNLFFFMERNNNQVIAVCNINNRGHALAIIKQFVLQEANDFRVWTGSKINNEVSFIPPFEHKTKFIERIEIDEDDRMAELSEEMTELELFNMSIRRRLKILRDCCDLNEQEQVDQLVRNFNDDYESSLIPLM